MNESRKATSDVSVRDEMSHFQELPREHREEHFQDHIGLAVFGKSGGNDIMMCSTIYHIGGKRWGLEDGAVQQTNLIIAPSDQRTMKNNDFVGNRMDPMRNYENFEVVEEKDRVTWKIGDRRIIARPPYWELKGEHLGVDVDLTIGGIGKSIPYHGLWDGLASHGVAGNEHLGWAEGTITYAGATHTLDEAWAVRERTCMGKGWDVLSLLGYNYGYLWGWCFSDAIKIFCFAQPESGHFSGRVFTGDQIVDFGKGEITVDVLESWKDPLTGVTYPTHWDIRMKSAQGTVEMDVNTWSRALFGFHLTPGYTTHHCALGRTRGRFVFPDGRAIPIDDSLSYFEQGKATPLGIG